MPCPALIDRLSLQACLSLARTCGSEVPVGALVRCNATRRVLATAANSALRLGSALAHAEMLALAAAQRALPSARLDGCTLYVSLEPCLMCLGAALASRVSRVVFASRSPKYGALSSGGLQLDHGAAPARAGGAPACAACAAAPPPAWLRASPVRMQVACAEDAPALEGCARQSSALLGAFFAARRREKLAAQALAR